MALLQNTVYLKNIKILHRCKELISITASRGIRLKATLALQASGCVKGNKHTHTLIGRNHPERERREERKEGGRWEEGREGKGRQGKGEEGEESEVPVVSELQGT